MTEWKNTAEAITDAIRRDDGQQHLLTLETFQTAALSLTAFYKASTHPYVIRKIRK